MQRTNINYYERRSLNSNTYTRWNQNIQRNINFRPQGQYLQTSIQNYDYRHWCETCDKGFPSAEFLDNHKRQHQKCNIDGCQIVAHPKIITKHIQMQHSTGLFKRIAKLNNPEDLNKWKEERKRKYPTIENIKKKQAEIKEKIDRGEKMGIKCERSKRNVNSDLHLKTNSRLRASRGNRFKQMQGKPNKDTLNNRKRANSNLTDSSEMPKKLFKIIPLKEKIRVLKPFAGIQFLNINDDVDTEISETQCSDPIEDDEDIHDSKAIKNNDSSISDTTVCTALTSLICSYGSSDDDEDDNNSNTPQKETKKIFNSNKNNVEIKNYDKINNPITKSIDGNIAQISKAKTPAQISEDNLVVKYDTKSDVPNCTSNNDEDSGPEEIQTVKENHCLAEDNKILNEGKPKKIFIPPKQLNRPANQKYELQKRNKLPSTLLEKLLHREIQQERNIILQCVRYVVKNDYFENT